MKKEKKTTSRCTRMRIHKSDFCVFVVVFVLVYDDGDGDGDNVSFCLSILTQNKKKIHTSS